MKKLKFRLFISYSIFVVLLLSSCKKDFTSLKNQSAEIQSTKAQNILPTTIQEKKLVKEISEITEVIKAVFKTNNGAIQEISSLCKLGYYKDSYIFMKDIMDENSNVVISQKNKINNSGTFRNEFLKIWKRNHNNNYRTFTAQDVSDFKNINIYFPYQDNFTTVDTSNVTLVPAQMDCNEAPGYKLESAEYVERLVNDDYAYINPTFIIGVTSTDATPWNNANASGIVNTDPQARWTSIAPQNLPAPPLPPSLTPPSNEVRKVYIGVSKCTKQYDVLVSFTGNGGGSEIRYTRTEGYLKFVDEQVTDIADVIAVEHSRSEIRDNARKFVVSAWDTDWEFDNKEQYFAIYEEDTKGEISFGGKLATKVVAVGGNTIEGEINFNIKRKSQDAIIRQFKITYRSYFLSARLDQGHGYLLGYFPIRILRYQYDYSFLGNNQCPWPTYDWNGGVGFTWPYQRIF